MKTFVLIVVHDDIDYVSDRTLRSHLKRLTHIVREVLRNEVRILTLNAGLGPVQTQAILDRIQNEVPTIPVFYLRNITQGSFHSELQLAIQFLVVLAGIAGGEVLKKASTQNKFFRYLVSYINDDRPDALGSALKEALEGQNLGGYFIVEAVHVTETKSRVIVNIELTTPMEYEQRIREVYEEAKLVNELQKRIRETD